MARRWRICLQCGRPRFHSWVGRSPREGNGNPSPVFLPGEFYGQRSLASCNLWDCKKLDTTECVHTHTPLRNEYISSLVAQMIKNPTAMQETWVQSLGQEDPLEKGMATHSGILAWRIPWANTTDQLKLSLFFFFICQSQFPVLSLPCFLPW